MALENAFNTAPPERHLPTEEVLTRLGLSFTLRADGDYDAEGTLGVRRNLDAMPDLSRVHLKGSLYCDNMKLTSLRGAPKSVSGDFVCNNNLLASLEHAPQSVGGDFFCNNNKITSLEHAPSSIGGDIYCTHNMITIMNHIPPSMGGGIYCNDNPIETFFGLPKVFNKIKSDHGVFTAYEQIPAHLLRDIPTEKQKKEILRTCAAVKEEIAFDPANMAVQQRKKLDFKPA